MMKSKLLRLFFQGKKITAISMLIALCTFQTIAQNIKVDTSYWGETAYGGIVLLLIDSKGGGTGGILYADTKTDKVFTAAGKAHFDGKKYYIEDKSGYKISFQILDETPYSCFLLFDDGDLVEIFKGFDDDFQDAVELFKKFR